MHSARASVQSVPVAAQMLHGLGVGPQHLTAGGSLCMPHLVESAEI